MISNYHYGGSYIGELAIDVALDTQVCLRRGSYTGRPTLQTTWQLHRTADFADDVAVTPDGRLCRRRGSYTGRPTLQTTWQLHRTADFADDVAVTPDGRLCRRRGSYTGQPTLQTTWQLHCSEQSTLPLKSAVTLDGRLCH